MNSRILLITALFLCVALTGCAAKKAIAKKIVIGSQPAVTPLSRSDGWWMPRHQAVLDRVKQGNVDMIWIGDSITNGWDGTGKSVWLKYYGKRNAVNMGFSGDETQHVLWRLQNGEISGLSPKLAILLIGINNTYSNVHTTQQIGDGITAICQMLRRDLPNTKILILGIFPSEEKLCAKREKNEAVNKIASKLADNKHIFYLDIGDKFLEPDGTISKTIMPDFIHPSEKGYEIWAAAMEPTVSLLMNEQ